MAASFRYRAMACLAKRATASASWPKVANPSTPIVPSAALSIADRFATSTSRIRELPARRGGMRSGSVRLLAALSTMQVLRRVTLSGYGFASAGMPKSFWNMRNAPGLAPRHA